MCDGVSAFEILKETLTAGIITWISFLRMSSPYRANPTVSVRESSVSNLLVAVEHKTLRLFYFV